jgi:SHS2 domain-containing protein
VTVLVRRATSHFRSAVFQFFDHTGDIGVDIDAADPGALFADAARAFSETITDRDALAADELIEVSLSADAIDLLLVDWLSELVYRFDADGWLARDVEVEVSGTSASDQWTLRARLSGGRLDPERHEVRVLVKAVTYHALEVVQIGARWHARVIFDI